VAPERKKGEELETGRMNTTFKIQKVPLHNLPFLNISHLKGHMLSFFHPFFSANMYYKGYILY
jgi:hypothetical protein